MADLAIGAQQQSPEVSRGQQGERENDCAGDGWQAQRVGQGIGLRKAYWISPVLNSWPCPTIGPALTKASLVMIAYCMKIVPSVLQTKGADPSTQER